MSRPWFHRAVCLLLAVWWSTGAPAAAQQRCWLPPVSGPIVDPFREPPCTWCAGNRGLEYEVGGSTVVRAVASGRVEFAGVVAGVAYVVTRLPNGWRHTYGRVSSIAVRTGTVVLAGTEVGRTDHRLFFGLRVGDRYVDPAPWLGELVLRPRLVPLDASSARPAPVPRLRCANASRSAGPDRDVTTPEPAASIVSSVRPDRPLLAATPHPSRRSSAVARHRRVPIGGSNRTGEPRHGSHHHAPDARSRRPLRSPDPPVEPEDEAIHLR